MTYTYDALGRQIGVDTNGTQRWTVFNGSSVDANPYADYTGSGTLSMRYLYGPAVDQILARTDPNANTAWYLTDQLGSVWNVVSSSGTVLDAITYDAYGNILSETSPSNGDRFKFAGMQYDAATGLYYDHARYYDPNTGRFVSQDPDGFAAGDTNLYRYVANTPTIATDPSGEIVILSPGAMATGLLYPGTGSLGKPKYPGRNRRQTVVFGTFWGPSNTGTGQQPVGANSSTQPAESKQ